MQQQPQQQTIPQLQQLQQQQHTLFPRQHVQQPQQQFNASIDPSILSLPQFHSDIKEESFLDNSNCFTLHNDFDMSGMGMNRVAAVVASKDQHMMSPLSASPHDNIDRGTPGFQTQPNGFYSMSMPMHPSSYSGVDANNFLGSHPSSFGSFGHTPTALSGSVEDEGKPSADVLIEKRRRRRESHNAVERRRRDHINEKIHELSNLLPEFASDIQNKPNKGVILRRSVDYIRHMQLFAAKQMERTMELEGVLARLIVDRGIREEELGLSVPLGTAIELPTITGVNQEEEDMM